MTIGAGLLAIAHVLKWPVLGGLFAAGAIATGRYLAPEVLRDPARDLAADAGAAFAEGAFRWRQAIEGAGSSISLLSGGGVARGRWSRP